MGDTVNARRSQPQASNQLIRHLMKTGHLFPNRSGWERLPARGGLLLLVGLVAGPPALRTAPVIPANSVTAAQRPSTDPHPKYVDIAYTISDPTSTSVNVGILVSQDSGATWTVPARTFPTGSGTSVGVNVPVTKTPSIKTFSWDAGADWDGQFTTRCRVRVVANNSGMVLIPAGSYLRGNPPELSDSDIPGAPQFSVYVSAFLMDAHEVTGGLWNSVKQGYADSHGYGFANAGSLKAANHPVQTVNWHDAVKWCNARSEKEGLAPVYYRDTAGGNFPVYRTGEGDVFMQPGANGYRLPTEAEWEKAARGGAVGRRFPWSDFEPISGNRANYQGNPSVFRYDLGPPGLNPTATAIGGGEPWTTPVGSFSPNGYNLYDMAGNAWEWCWDSFSPTYYVSGQTDPQGPNYLSHRVLRGGSFGDQPRYARCAERYAGTPNDANNRIGFRCVRALP